jgi:carbon-monoxide dehydrogenase small subunit
MPALEMTVNGKPISLEVDGLRTLVDVLRECGACTVLLDGEAVNSCLIPAMKAHGHSVVTIEGVGTVDAPHPVQEAIARAGGTQCGYCTPGFVMSAVALLERNPQPTVDEIREAIAGNLCRCTGYRRIVRGIQEAAKRMSSGT